MRDAPRFSVILPTCNRPDMLMRAISSVARQTFSDFELIIVDDGTTPVAQAMIAHASGGNVRYIRTSGAMGVSVARNRGVAAALGSYLSFLDDDDEYCESFLEATHNTIREVGVPCVTWCGAALVDYSESHGGIAKVRMVGAPAAGSSFLERLDALVGVGIGFGVSIAAAVLKKEGGFDETLHVGSDTDLFLRISGCGTHLAPIDGFHIIIHNHSGERLTNPSMDRARADVMRALLQRHSGFLSTCLPIREMFLAYARKLESQSVPMGQNAE